MRYNIICRLSVKGSSEKYTARLLLTEEQIFEELIEPLIGEHKYILDELIIMEDKYESVEKHRN